MDWVICAADLRYLTGREVIAAIRKRHPLLYTVIYGQDGDGRRRDQEDADVPSFTIEQHFAMEKLRKLIEETGRQRL